MRTIAAGRLILAAYWLLALLLDPPESLAHRAITYALLYTYSAYALARVLLLWHTLHSSRQWQVASHVIDLSVFAALTLLAEGAASPFYLGFLFSLVCATLLFDMRGMNWTAASALALYVAISYATHEAPDFEPARFIVRVSSLVAITALLTQLKMHETRLQRDYRKLAEWPRGSVENLPVMITDVLQHAKTLLRAPRLVVVWDNPNEAMLHVASVSTGGVIVREDPLGTFDPVVDRSARLKSFVVTKWLRSPAARSEAMTEGLQPLAANPIHPAFRARFIVEDVVASRFTGDTISGWLFALDQHDLTEDDLVLTDIAASLVESRLEQFYLAATVRDNAVVQERIRCARDLHDGVLQSLSGTALHLHCLHHLIEKDADAALFSLAEVEQALAADQREMRAFIGKLRSAVSGEDEPRLAVRLATLGERIQREWGLKVTIETNPLIEIVAPGMAEEIYRLVKEALTNAAIHSNGNRVSVEVSVRNERARIVIADNGRGFAFAGRYNLVQLTEMRRGPVTLKERIATIGGNLVVDSNERGARLEIDVPLSLAATALP